MISFSSIRQAIAVVWLAMWTIHCSHHGKSHLSTNEYSTPDGVMLFLTHDFGGITVDTMETGALPFKLVQTAMILQESERQNVVASLEAWPLILNRFGILSPRKIVYASGQTAAWDGSPLGVTKKYISPLLLPFKVEGFNIGCAICHSSVGFRADGIPDPQVAWIGAPSTSFNPEAYIAAIYDALKYVVSNEDKVLKEMERLNPDMGWIERMSMSTFIMPRVKDRMKDLEGSIQRAFPFSNGGPGLTNGIGALKYQLGLIPKDRLSTSSGFTSIPSVADRLYRSSLLYDGLYTPKGESSFRMIDSNTLDPKKRSSGLVNIVAYFSVPAMGVHPAAVKDQLPTVLHAFTDTIAPFRPASFPGKLDQSSVARGQQLFNKHCAACHGTYSGELAIGSHRLSKFPNRLSPISEIGTDPQRMNEATPEVIESLNKSEFGQAIDIAAYAGYVAPILTGLWSSAPYLHNGSVPTLWHLLNPELRPCRFEVGGHALDFKSVGIRGAMHDGEYRFEDSYKGYSTSQVFDCTSLGRNNRGHERQFTALTSRQKWDLIEYLKIL